MKATAAVSRESGAKSFDIIDMSCAYLSCMGLSALWMCLLSGTKIKDIAIGMIGISQFIGLCPAGHSTCKKGQGDDHLCHFLLYKG